MGSVEHSPGICLCCVFRQAVWVVSVSGDAALKPLMKLRLCVRLPFCNRRVMFTIPRSANTVLDVILSIIEFLELPSSCKAEDLRLTTEDGYEYLQRASSVDFQCKTGDGLAAVLVPSNSAQRRARRAKKAPLQPPAQLRCSQCRKLLPRKDFARRQRGRDNPVCRQDTEAAEVEGALARQSRLAAANSAGMAERSMADSDDDGAEFHDTRGVPEIAGHLSLASSTPATIAPEPSTAVPSPSPGRSDSSSSSSNEVDEEFVAQRRKKKKLAGARVGCVKYTITAARAVHKGPGTRFPKAGAPKPVGAVVMEHRRARDHKGNLWIRVAPEHEDAAWICHAGLQRC